MKKLRLLVKMLRFLVEMSRFLVRMSKILVEMLRSPATFFENFGSIYVALTSHDDVACHVIPQQDDAFFSMQTVQETLVNAARLRLPQEMSIRDKLDRVESIIQELGLKKAANTRIGNARNRGVSGGERKRTNIGVEMMQDPSLLFLDEPTSGLDAFQALNVMETLKLLTLSGVTVLVSVHQPRFELLGYGGGSG